MRHAIILHGTLGSPEGNWFAWLRTKLENKGLRVWVPKLPHPQQPSLKEWAAFVRAHCPFAIDEDTLVIGHSSGAILSLVLAQQNQSPIGAIVAVSVIHDNRLNWDPNSRIFDVPYNWPVIRKKCQAAGVCTFRQRPVCSPGASAGSG